MNEDTRPDEEPDEEQDYTLTAAAEGFSSTFIPDNYAPFLVHIGRGGVKGRSEIGDQPLVIGRRGSTDLRVSEPTVSGRHCSVMYAMGQVILTDLDSRNGTFIDKKRVAGSVILPAGAVFAVGSHAFLLEYRARDEVAEERDLAQDLGRAQRYVESILPAPLAGTAIGTDWAFVPSVQLGGDGFGYDWLDERFFVVYLIDVCGHGVEAAMHSVSVLNLLRQKSLPDTDFTNCAEVLTGLNQVFDMDNHGGTFFTLWYGVYDRESRTLSYASAGHPPAYHVSEADGRFTPLRTKNPPIGTTPGMAFKDDTVGLQAKDRLYIYSDGAFEIETRDGKTWGLDEFQRVLIDSLQSPEGVADRVYQTVREASATELGDDFSLVEIRFP